MLKNMIPPILSSGELENREDLENAVILDIRTREEYEAGHIPGAVNIPFEMPQSVWTCTKGDLLMEVPDDKELRSSFSNYGLAAESHVIILTQVDDVPPFSLANATRVAAILAYGGIKKVSILDGGMAKWKTENRPLTTEIPELKPVAFTGTPDKNLFVSLDYVARWVKAPRKETVLIDSRDREVFEGLVIEPFAPKAGHIPGASSLPTPSLWKEDGTYKSKEELAHLAREVAGEDKKKEIIIYCGVGGYASTLWFVLTRVLDYRNVKIFNGSAQEWIQKNEMVIG